MIREKSRIIRNRARIDVKNARFSRIKSERGSPTSVPVGKFPLPNNRTARAQRSQKKGVVNHSICSNISYSPRGHRRPPTPLRHQAGLFCREKKNRPHRSFSHARACTRWAERASHLGATKSPNQGTATGTGSLHVAASLREHSSGSGAASTGSAVPHARRRSANRIPLRGCATARVGTHGPHCTCGSACAGRNRFAPLRRR